jgi:L-iditol 2-dehydrogenase
VMETYADACESCRYCQSGRRNLCANRRSIGVHVDGGFATELLIPVRNLHKVPPGIEPYAAALAEPLACVCNCLFDPSVVNGGDEVLVTGPGPVGLLAAQCARAAGGHVTVVGLHSDEARLKVASDLGFATSFQGDPSTFDVVIECSGSASGAALCLDAVVPGGRYVQVGVFGRSVEIPLDHMFRKELLMTSGCASTPASWRRALQIIPSGEIELSLLVTDVVPLQSWEAAFSRFKTGVGLKTLIDPRLS